MSDGLDDDFALELPPPEPDAAVDIDALSRVVEALLFASKEPMDETTLRNRLPTNAPLKVILTRIAAHYDGRGVNLERVGRGWAFRTAADLAGVLRLSVTVKRKLSRAAVETMSIIAYHQPITRAEVEEIRGVALSRGTLDTLLEAGWIQPRGRRKVPGRPLQWGTTDSFLDHFGLEDLAALPGLDDLKAAGLLDRRPGLTSIAMQDTDDDDDIADDQENLFPLDLDAAVDAGDDVGGDGEIPPT